MKTRTKRILSFSLAAILVAATLPQAAWAEEGRAPAGADSEIIAFNPLADTIANQTVPLGTALQALVLPDTLTATVSTPLPMTVSGAGPSGQVTETTASVPVAWQARPDYDSGVPDTYIFDAEITGGSYTLGDSAVLPGITVTVGEAAQPFVTFSFQQEGPLYLPEGTAVTEEELLFGITAETENSIPVAIALQSTDGLDMENPQPKDDRSGYNIAYSAVHPVTGQVFTGGREAYVTEGMMPLSSTPEIIDLSDSDGELSIAAGNSGGRYSYDTATKTVTISGPVTVTGSTTERQVLVQGTVSVTLENVNIDVSAIGEKSAFQLLDGANATVILEGDNVLKSGGNRAGLQTTSGSAVTITAPDTSHSLTASGGQSAAGIGGNAHSTGGSITINGGTIVAHGGRYGAGMGGGQTGNNGSITINGGKVTANSIEYAAGIGGGSASYGGGAGGTITISGGIVDATGHWGGAGLGGGGSSFHTGASGGNITISGGTVTASSSAGTNRIGHGDGGNEGNITITGGSILTTIISPQPTNVSQPVYLNTLTVGNPSIGDGTAFSDIGYDGTEYYGCTGVVTRDGGRIYLWLPENSDSAAKVEAISDGTYYRKFGARTGITETGTLLRDGNAAVPDIIQDPSDRTVDAGGSTNLTVEASVTDGGTLSYQWQRAEGASGGSFADIEGAVSDTWIPGTETPGTSRYRVIVTNTNRSVNGSQTAAATSETATVTVNAIVDAETPDITTHPRSRTVNAGDSAMLTVEASVTDGGILSYQWQRAEGASGGSFADIEGAVSDTWIPGTETLGTSRYRVIVTNTNRSVNGSQTASATSNTASFTVAAAPSGGFSSGSSDQGGNASSVPAAPLLLPDQPTIGSILGKTAGTSARRAMTVTDGMVEEALKKAEEEAKAKNRSAFGVGVQIVLDASSAQRLTLTLERAALERLLRAGAKELAFTEAPLSLAFNAQALGELQKQGTGDITLGIQAVKIRGVRSAYDITLRTEKDGKTVSINSLGKGSVMVSIPCTPGRKESTGLLYAVYVEDGGSQNPIPGAFYDTNRKRMIFRTDHFSVYGVSYKALSVRLADTEEHWAKEAMDYVAGRGLLEGSAGGEFHPDTEITRGELVTALGRMTGIDVNAYQGSILPNGYSGSYALPYIAWARDKGLFQGAGSSGSAPEDRVTRQEMAVILYQYTKTTGYTLPVTRIEKPFADRSAISSSSQTAVTAMQQAGILMSRQDNLFQPTAKMTRAEASAILYRYAGLAADPATAQGWARNDAGQSVYYKDGKALTGWQEIGENGSSRTYYFDAYGSMVSGGWQRIDGMWYYFNEDGSLAPSARIDGFEIDDNGVSKSS